MFKNCLILFSFIIFASNYGFSQISKIDLGPNQDVIVRGKDRGVHVCRTAALSGECVRYLILQSAGDVRNTVVAPSGAVSKSIDRSNGSLGRETVAFIASNPAFI